MNHDQNTNVNERSSDQKNKESLGEPLQRESDTPLFLRDGSENAKGNAQDEKDKSEE